MTDYRERAIKDVAEATGVDKHAVKWVRARVEDTRTVETRTVGYAVAQREARLRLEEALGNLLEATPQEACDEDCSFDNCPWKQARAALEAVKEKG